MGTSCRLVVVPPPGVGREQDARVTHQALTEAEAALRRVEAQMSTWIDATPLSRFNRAPPGERFPLPAPVVHVLRRSRELHAATDGAFDVTCRPLIELWRAAGKSGQLPPPTAIAKARAASSWNVLDLADDGVTKHAPGARVDLGGIAKGYAIDQAVAAMRRAGAHGGLVDVGGDVRVFGQQPSQSPWEIQLRDPSGTGVIGTFPIREGAVCTSGDYFRFAEIAGQRYSHIIDPRSGRPARGVRSATVVAPDALTADAWATALSVLGEAGLDRVPPDLEAVLILGRKGHLRAVATAGFRHLIRDDLPYPTTFR